MAILILHSSTADGLVRARKLASEIAFIDKGAVVALSPVSDGQRALDGSPEVRLVVLIWTPDLAAELVGTGLVLALRSIEPAKQVVVLWEGDRASLPPEIRELNVISHTTLISSVLFRQATGRLGGSRGIKRGLDVSAGVPAAPTPARPGAVPSHAPATEPPRFTDVLFQAADELPQRPLPDAEALRMGRVYFLEVAVRGRRIGIGAAAADRVPLTLPRIHPKTTLVLLASVESDDFDVVAEASTILLPARGDARRAARFRLQPRRPQPRATVNVKVLHEFNLIESLTVGVTVVEGEPAGEAVPATVTQALRFASYEALDRMIPRSMSVLVRAVGRRYRVGFMVRDRDSRSAYVETMVDLPIAELEDLLARTRSLLDDLAGGGFTAPDGGLAARADGEAQRLVGELARVGRESWSALFKRDVGTGGFALGAWLTEHPLPEGAIVQVAVTPEAQSFVFPWALLFDQPVQPVDDGGDLASLLGGFWGGRYAIEQRPPGAAAFDQPIAVDRSLEAGFMLWKQFQNSALQEGLWQALQEESAGRLHVTRAITTARQCLDLLQTHAFDLLYFYTHGQTRTPMERRGPPITDDHLRAEGSYIELSFGRIYLRDLYDGIAVLPSTPLVFLNMCDSAQMTPSLGESFVHFFLNRGAPVVIGTECKMTIEFAHPFADEFLRRFLRGANVGSALLEARRSFLSRGNPLGLAYGLFGSATLAYSPAVRGADFAVEAASEAASGGHNAHVD